MKKIILIAAIVLLGGAALWHFQRGRGNGSSSYRFVTIEKGNLERVVSSTGTLDAVTTVEVGTQVSGIISKIYVDFNDKVKKGQVIARLDTTLLAIAVREAKVNLEQNQAHLLYAEREYERVKRLHEKQVVSESEFNEAQYNVDIAGSSVKSSQIKLEQAERNLAYATIYAPISGTVIERDVDVGQTVAASFSSPRLFLIANDLSRMQILVSVDESDIGLIKEGQIARFTVQAYPDETFTGTVKQVRLQSTISENVVNYTAVVDVENKEGKLLPGMTATVDLLIETASDVLKVANAALRFRPTEEMIAELRKRMPRRDRTSLSRRDSTRFAGADMDSSTNPTASGEFSKRTLLSNAAMLYYLDDKGNIAVARVRTGISDGTSTVIEGQNIEPGMQIIAAVTQSSQSSATNPFQNQQRGRRGPGF